MAWVGSARFGLAQPALIRTFEVVFRSATSTNRRMQAGVAQGGITSPCPVQPVRK